METKPASLDGSWTKYYLDKIERHKRSGGLSGHIASVREAGMVPAAGLGDAAWHGWQAIKQSDGWHLVRSFALLATSISSLPLIIIAPDTIVTASDKLRIREQWDKPNRGLYDRIKPTVASTPFLVGLIIGVTIEILYQSRFSSVAEASNSTPPSENSISTLNMLGTTILGGLLTFPLWQHLKQPNYVQQPQLIEALEIYDPAPTDPQAIWERLLVFNQNGSVVGAKGKCHVAEILDGKVRINDWSDMWVLTDENTIKLGHYTPAYRPSICFDFVTSYFPEKLYTFRVDGQSYQATLDNNELTFEIDGDKKSFDVRTLPKAQINREINDNGTVIVGSEKYECQLRRYDADTNELIHNDSSLSPNYAAIFINDLWIEFPIIWKTEPVKATMVLKIQNALCAPFVNVRWRGKNTERAVCEDPILKSHYVLIGGEKHLVQDYQGRQAIIVNGNPIFLEYKYVPPQNIILHEEGIGDTVAGLV